MKRRNCPTNRFKIPTEALPTIGQCHVCGTPVDLATGDCYLASTKRFLCDDHERRHTRSVVDASQNKRQARREAAEADRENSPECR